MPVRVGARGATPRAGRRRSWRPGSHRSTTRRRTPSRAPRGSDRGPSRPGGTSRPAVRRPGPRAPRRADARTPADPPSRRRRSSRPGPGRPRVSSSAIARAVVEAPRLEGDPACLPAIWLPDGVVDRAVRDRQPVRIPPGWVGGEAWHEANAAASMRRAPAASPEVAGTGRQPRVRSRAAGRPAAWRVRAMPVAPAVSPRRAWTAARLIQARGQVIAAAASKAARAASRSPSCAALRPRMQLVRRHAAGRRTAPPSTGRTPPASGRRRRPRRPRGRAAPPARATARRRCRRPRRPAARPESSRLVGRAAYRLPREHGGIQAGDRHREGEQDGGLVDPGVDELLAGDVDAGEQRRERQTAFWPVFAAAGRGRSAADSDDDHDRCRDDADQSELRDRLRRHVVRVRDVVVDLGGSPCRSGDRGPSYRGPAR